MTHLENAHIERIQVELLANGPNWATAKRLPTLGRRGRILAVKLRMDQTDAAGTAATLYLADDALTATPDDLDVSYVSAGIVLAGSATTASLDHTLTTPVPYCVRGVGDLRVNAVVTAGGAGNTRLYVVIYAEVWA